MIYLDCDGVLADFAKWILEINNIAFKNDFQLTSTLLQHYKEAFLMSETTKQGMDLLSKIKEENFEYRILTSLPKIDPFLKYYPHLQTSYKENGKMLDIDFIFQTFAKNKIRWCVDKLNVPCQNVIIVSNQGDKMLFCKGFGDVLYDDNPKTIQQWISNGGDGRLVNYSILGER